jgi:hypothetical protein
MNKYHAVKTEVDGYVFDSQKEARRYSVLKTLESDGDISDLELQPKFHIVLNGEKICTYIADFRYFDNYTKGAVTEDVKSAATRKIPIYRLKKKLVEAQFGITISEV